MIKITLTISIFILVAQVILVNRISDSGAELTKLASRIETVKIENELLKINLYEKQSLLKLTQNAQNAGFSAAKVSFERTPQPVAASDF